MLKFTAEIESGTYGTVYKGQWNDKTVAIKEMKRNRKSVALQEIAILKRLDHPNLMALLADIQAGDVTYLVMNLMAYDLFTLMSEHPTTITKELAFSISQDLVAGLNYMHQKNILHKDIKPENILLTSDNQAKLADFGGSIDETNEETSITGSVDYFSPQVADVYASGEDYFKFTKADDIYSLGITLLELMIKDKPYPYTFHDDDFSFDLIIHCQYKSIPSDISPILKSIIENSLHKTPGDRISTAKMKSLFPLLLLEPGSTIPKGVSGESHPIHFACKTGSVLLVEKLISECPKLINLVDDNGDTPLTLAVKNHHLDIINLLINHKANINKPCGDGKPLDIASFQRADDIMLLLYEKGALVSKPIANHYHIMHSAAKKGRDDILQKLINKFKNSINVCDNRYKTPLYYARIKSNESTASLLVRHGARFSTLTLKSASNKQSFFMQSWYKDSVKPKSFDDSKAASQAGRP